VVKWVVGMRDLIRFEDDGDGDALPDSDFENEIEKLKESLDKATSNGMTKMFNQWEEAYDKYEEKEKATPANMFDEWEAAYDKYQDRVASNADENTPRERGFHAGSPVRFQTAGSMLDFQRNATMSDTEFELKQQATAKNQQERESRYLVTDSTVNLLKTEFIDRRMERYQEEFKRLYKQIRVEPKQFQVGEKVEVRQCVIWREGVITSLNPLKVQPNNWSKSFRWMEVRRPLQETDYWKALQENVRANGGGTEPPSLKNPESTLRSVTMDENDSKRQPEIATGVTLSRAENEECSEDETSMSLDPSSLPATISAIDHKRDPYQPTKSVIQTVREVSHRDVSEETDDEN